MDVSDDNALAKLSADDGAASAATARPRLWVRPLAVAVVVVCAWAALVIPANDDQGLATWEFLILATALFAAMVWRGTAWGRARMEGASRGGLVARAIAEGIGAGVVIGIVTFLVAQYRVESDSPNVLGVLVVIPWLIIGAMVFAVLCAISIAGRHARSLSASLPR